MAESDATGQQLLEAMRAADGERGCSFMKKTGDGRWRRCHSKSLSECAYCAGIELGDELAVARDGIFDEDGELLIDTQFWFVTFTAPSFGKVHFSPHEGREACTCGEVHLQGDDIVGSAIGSYRYEEQILWNAASGALWRNFMERLTYRYPLALYWRVRELQARCAVHYHGILKFPAGDIVTEVGLSGILRKAVAVNLRGLEVRFGREADFQMLGAKEAATKIYYATKALGYSLKDYTTPEGVKTSAMSRTFAAKVRNFRCSSDCFECIGREHCTSSAYGHRGHPGCAGPNPKEGRTLCVGCKNPIHRNIFGSSHRVTRSRQWAHSGLTKQMCQMRRLDFALARVDGDRKLAAENGAGRAFDVERKRKMERIEEEQKRREKDRRMRSYEIDHEQRQGAWKKSRGA